MQVPSGFICTGEDINFAYRKDLWEYNYYADAWVQRADYPGPGRTNATSFIVSDFAFVGTGFNGEFQDDMYAYLRILNVDEIPLPATPVSHHMIVQEKHWTSKRKQNRGMVGMIII